MSQHTHQSTRRSFLAVSSTMLGASMLPNGKPASAGDRPLGFRPKSSRLPREVWVATISQNNLQAANYRQMIQQMLGRMREVVCFEPDIICLPEVFPFVNLDTPRPSIAQVAEAPIGAISTPFAQFAKKYNCHVICPIYTSHEGKYYNSAVFIDRDGKVAGQYHKMHPTTGEVDAGVAPGPLDPKVVRTDFGQIGAQICFDIQWNDGWEKLAAGGAEIVFWPSAFGGGQMINAKAWENNYCVVSSTRKGVTQICDVTGETIARTSHWDRWICAPLNLEKAFLHTWPYVRRFADIRNKYGRKVRIRNFAEEEWTVIESLDPEVKIADLMREFELKTLREHVAIADSAQRAARG